jgi:microsomal epoxide hydrolase
VATALTATAGAVATSLAIFASGQAQPTLLIAKSGTNQIQKPILLTNNQLAQQTNNPVTPATQLPANAQLSRIRPFQVNIPDATIQAIMKRVRDYQAPDQFSGADWNSGPSPQFMQALLDYWKNGYDWRKAEAQINRFPNFKAEIDGEQLHFIYERGSGSNPQPIILLHGWPHNFAAFLDVIEPLAHPERFGVNPEDGLTVIVPSFPNTGFSGKSAQPLGTRAIAERMHKLMTEVLGYDKYFVQGGDWGSWVGTWMALNHPTNVKGLHLNHVYIRHDGAPLGSGRLGNIKPTDEERAFVAEEARTFAGFQAAYFYQLSARPQSVAYAIADSPVGSAAWYIDKFYLWSDHSQRSFEQIFTKDQLLTQIMVNLVTSTDDSAMWIYKGFANEGVMTLPPGRRIKVPVAFLATHDPFNKPAPPTLIKRDYNLVQWTVASESGHWPMMERPDLFVADVRKFTKSVRD